MQIPAFPARSADLSSASGVDEARRHSRVRPRGLPPPNTELPDGFLLEHEEK